MEYIFIARKLSLKPIEILSCMPNLQSKYTQNIINLEFMEKQRHLAKWRTEMAGRKGPLRKLQS